jgi:LysR family tcuABC transcriptional regulator
VDTVAEIDSLPLLMHCVSEGIGATIKPMAAVHALDNSPGRWRALRIADARMTRTNYLYALQPQKLSACAAVVRDELKRTVRHLAQSGQWQGVTLCDAPGVVPGAAGALAANGGSTQDLTTVPRVVRPGSRRPAQVPA